MNIQETLTVLVFILLVAFLNGLRISFMPFKVTFSDWHLFIAWMMLVGSLIIFKTDIHGKAYNKGLKNGSDMMLELLTDEIEDEEETK